MSTVWSIHTHLVPFWTDHLRFRARTAASDHVLRAITTWWPRLPIANSHEAFVCSEGVAGAADCWESACCELELGGGGRPAEGGAIVKKNYFLLCGKKKEASAQPRTAAYSGGPCQVSTNEKDCGVVGLPSVDSCRMEVKLWRPEENVALALSQHGPCVALVVRAPEHPAPRGLTSCRGARPLYWVVGTE